MKELTPLQSRAMNHMIFVWGYSVRFCPTDPLNPMFGLECHIEGPFGKASGYGMDLATAFGLADVDLSKKLRGL